MRAAVPDREHPLGWRVQPWVKRGILLGFRLGHLQGEGAATLEPRFPYIDKHTYPARSWTPEDGVRVVPGGSAVRSGAYLAPGVVCMPPMYVNVGAYVDAGTMIDSHAPGRLLRAGRQAGAHQRRGADRRRARAGQCESGHPRGRCAGRRQLRRVRGHHRAHRRRACAAGTVLTRGTPVYDLVHGTVLRATADQPLIIPQNAVVVPGARAIAQDKLSGEAAGWGLSLYTPVLVKYATRRRS